MKRITNYSYRVWLKQVPQVLVLSLVLQEYLIFYKIKVSQMMNWSAPLRRARRDD
jgi:hypothetical protein